MDTLESRARDFAYAAHNANDHRRKYTDEPYTTHLQRVASLVESVGGDSSMIAAAYLHDTVEDTATTIDDIRATFGDDVAYLVSYLTDVSKPADGNRALRKKLDREHIAQGDARVHTIKLADLIDNGMSITTHDPRFAKVFMTEKRELLTVLGDGDATLFKRARVMVETYMASLGTPSIEVTTLYPSTVQGQGKVPVREKTRFTLREYVSSVYVPRLYEVIVELGVIPPRHVLNEVLALGPAGPYVREWTPIEVTEEAYDSFVTELHWSMDGYCIEDRSLWQYADYSSWRAALGTKLRDNPTFKPLKFSAQHRILGIPLGRDRWLSRREIDPDRRAYDVDHILSPLRDFLHYLQHCHPDCCAIQAFSFEPEQIVEAGEKCGRAEIIGALDRVLIDLENLQLERTEVRSSALLNTSLHIDELVSLLRHLHEEVCRFE
ncbi:MAG: DUF6331 family protein [Pseudomonadales bacterium]